jgi:DNA-binding transcriptional LysR family regulator
VTEQIQALELDLGATLFDRQHRRLSLAPAGHRLLHYARDILTLSGEAHRTVANGDGRIDGPLVVGGIDSLCLDYLPALVSRFGADFPQVRVTLRAAKARELRDAVRGGTVDVYFTFGDVTREPDVQVQLLSHESIVLAAHPGHPLARKAHIELAELEAQVYAITVEGCPIRAAFERAFSTTAARPRVLAEFGSIAAMRVVVEAGSAIALFPQSAVKAALNAGTLISLPGMAFEQLPIYMVWRSVRHPSTALRHFLDASHHGTPQG